MLWSLLFKVIVRRKRKFKDGKMILVPSAKGRISVTGFLLTFLHLYTCACIILPNWAFCLSLLFILSGIIDACLVCLEPKIDNNVF